MERLSFQMQPQWGWCVGLVVVVLACALPLRKLSQMDARHAVVDQQLLQISTLAAEAAQLQAQAHLPAGDRAEQLRTAVQQALGAQATVHVQEATATLTFSQLPAVTLAQGLEQVRLGGYVRYTAAKMSTQNGLVSGSVDMQLAVAP